MKRLTVFALLAFFLFLSSCNKNSDSYSHAQSSNSKEAEFEQYLKTLNDKELSILFKNLLRDRHGIPDYKLNKLAEIDSNNYFASILIESLEKPVDQNPEFKPALALELLSRHFSHKPLVSDALFKQAILWDDLRLKRIALLTDNIEISKQNLNFMGISLIYSNTALNENIASLELIKKIWENTEGGFKLLANI